MWQCNGGANQKWSGIGDGVLRNGTNPALVLDARGGSPMYRGQDVMVCWQNGGDNQYWRIA